MGYLHPEINVFQRPRNPGQPCGDVAQWKRTSAGTTLLVADGLGSGIKANLDATLFTSWIQQHLENGASLRETMARVVPTLREARNHDVPFAAISLGRVRPDGGTILLNYEAPPPLLISDRCATVPRHHTVMVGAQPIRESECRLAPGDALMLVSDGITEAGLGADMPRGWTIEGVRKRVHHRVQRGRDFGDVADGILRHAFEISGHHGDDATVMLATCQRGKVVNILTGPPSNQASDASFVNRFLDQPGQHVICGGSTAEMVARELGTAVDTEQTLTSNITPPRATIDGIDLVTEGSISLNQVYNILDEPPEEIVEDSGVTDLYHMLQHADRINITVGTAHNPTSDEITFRQRGIVKREKIVPLLAEKLRDMGKLVVVRRDRH